MARPECEKYLKEHRQRHLDFLLGLVHIPSVSPDDTHLPDRVKCAGVIKERLDALGFQNVQLIPKEGHAPLVYGEYRDAGQGKPTIMIYCHYDVMPGWEFPKDGPHKPFDPVIDDKGIMWGRGAIDDKGQLAMHLAVLDTLLKVDGKLPVNVKCLFEGEEEVGSDWLIEFLQKTPPMCDALVVSDTDFFAKGQPALTAGLRGITTLMGTVTGPSHELHSGLYGGAVQNPTHAMATLLSSLHTPEGWVAVPHFYDKVISLSEEERQAWRSLPFDEEKYKRDLGVKELFGEPGYSTLERLWARPTVEVNAYTGGDVATPGVKTSIPSQATFKISCRLAPGQDPHEIRELVKQHLLNHVPAGVTLTLTEGSACAPAVLIDTTGPVAKVAAAALEKEFGGTCIPIRSGGSVPVVGTMKECLKVEPVLLGVGLPDDNIHAPEEHFDLDQFDRGAKALCDFWDEIGKVKL